MASFVDSAAGGVPTGSTKDTVGVRVIRLLEFVLPPGHHLRDVAKLAALSTIRRSELGTRIRSVRFPLCPARAGNASAPVRYQVSLTYVSLNIDMGIYSPECSGAAGTPRSMVMSASAGDAEPKPATITVAQTAQIAFLISLAFLFAACPHDSKLLTQAGDLPCDTSRLRIWRPELSRALTLADGSACV